MSATDDLVAIWNLDAAYCHRIDAGDGDGYADLFTDDGVFEIVGLNTASGREELAANARMFPQFMPATRHQIHDTHVELDGDRARQTAYLSVVATGAEPRIVQTGRYVDELVRTADGWRYARRTLTLDGQLT